MGFWIFDILRIENYNQNFVAISKSLKAVAMHGYKKYTGVLNKLFFEW